MFEPNEKGDKPLDPAILARAQRVAPGTSIAVKGAMTARRAANEAEAAAQAAEAAARVAKFSHRTVVVGGAKRSRSKLTPEAKRQYLDLLAKAVTPPAAAAAVGVTMPTIRARMKADPEFADAVKVARAEASAPIVEALYETALAGNFNAQKYLLENLDPENWFDRSKKIEVAVSGQIESLTPGDRAAQIERIAALEARLAERLALRAAGDQIEEDMVEDAEIEDAPQIEGDDDA